ncbi:MAG: YqiA/YcfP family alpha/beta fold hydrolase [Candidatus Thalassarchaeaceae archaeon]
MLFAHGFEGSPTGSKPTYMMEALGWDVTAPKMSELGWSIASQTEVLIRLLDKGDFDLVIGSSMGGLAAANASSMRPQTETRLLLIAPAFGLAENWEGMEEAGRSAWKTTGERRYTGYELDIVLPWEFMESAEKMSWPRPAHPTAIMHGKYDEVVPISFSRKVAEGCENVILHETDDSHRMKDSLRLIPEIVSKLMEGSDVSLEEIAGYDGGGLSIEKEKPEVPEELSTEVSKIVDEGDVSDSQADIEQLEAEMERLQAEMEKKKAALESSKKEPLPEKESLKESLDDEKERLSIEASDAIVKAEEEVELAKEEVSEAIKRAEQEEAEAEEARLVAEMEEDEAREAKAYAEAAKRKLDDALRKADLAGKGAEQFTEEMEREKREGLILERVTERGDSLDWSKIGISEGNNPDDLSLINGIEEFTQRKLNALGIFTFRQIANIDSDAGKDVNDALELLPGKVAELAWAQQAITMLELKGVDESSSKPDVDDDEVIADLSAAQIKWAQIGKAGDRKSDELTLIKGVDAETEKKLKVLGVRTFDQISKMDNETAEAVNGALGLMPGRVLKMMWADQAKTLKKR